MFGLRTYLFNREIFIIPQNAELDWILLFPLVYVWAKDVPIESVNFYNW